MATTSSATKGNCGKFSICTRFHYFYCFQKWPIFINWPSLQDLDKDIGHTDNLVEEAVVSSEALLAHCTPDDEEIIKNKLDKLNKDNGDLKEKKENMLALLNDTLDLSKMFFGLDKEANSVFMDVNEKLLENEVGEADKIMVSLH